MAKIPVLSTTENCLQVVFLSPVFKTEFYKSVGKYKDSLA